jgi:hypothetical protein
MRVSNYPAVVHDFGQLHQIRHYVQLFRMNFSFTFLYDLRSKFGQSFRLRGHIEVQRGQERCTTLPPIRQMRRFHAIF